MSYRSSFAALALALAIAFPPAAAGAHDIDESNLFLRVYNDFFFHLNQAVYRQIDTPHVPDDAFATVPPPPEPPLWKRGLGNMASNIVNEPMSLLAASLAGDVDGASRAGSRFALNSTVGVLGLMDVAGDWGIKPYHTDLGLALCAAGVPEGPYMVFPLIGPRTFRDGFMDIVVTNFVMYAMFAPLLPTGAGLTTIAIVESVELIADLAVTRQIDPRAKALDFYDYDALRAQYLTQRRARCEAARAK